MKFFKNTAKRLSNSNWVITLLSTMIGVILGFYLTNSNESRKLETDRINAVALLGDEIDENHKKLKEFDSVFKINLKKLHYLESFLNEDMHIVVAKDSVSLFKETALEIIHFKDTVAYQKTPNYVKVNGDLNLSFNSNLMFINLTSSVWNAYNTADFVKKTNFLCLRDIGQLHQFQEGYNKELDKWRTLFFKTEYMKSKEEYSKFLEASSKLALHNKLLLNFFSFKNQALKKCKEKK